MSFALGDLAVRFGCALRGGPERRVDHIAPLGAADASALSFLANARLSSELPNTRAGAVVLAPESAEFCPVPALISPDPHSLFARIAALLHPEPAPVPGIHASAVVDSTAQINPSAELAAHCVVGPGVVIGPRCRIGPGCVLERGVQVGADTHLVAHVTVRHGVRLGQRVLIHPGAVLGADGFGFAREQGHWIKVPQIGTVVVGDDVEIGANTTVDRGAMQDTVLSDGVKLDNLIQIAHNVQIGAHTAIAACTGVSGSVRIGARCIIGGGVGIAGHIEICDDVVVAGKTSVSSSIHQPGVYASLWPAEPLRRWKRIVARLKILAQRESSRSGNQEAQEAQEADDE